MHIDIIIGQSNVHRNKVETLVSRLPSAECHVGVDDMASLMTAADLCIGAGGTTLWERLCVGLPTIVIAIAENQRKGTEDLARRGYIIYSGWHEEVTAERLSNDLLFMIRHAEVRELLSTKSRELVDGRGVARVYNRLLVISGDMEFRPTGEKDMRLLFEWRNHLQVRKNFFNSSPVLWEEHCDWLQRKMASPGTYIYMVERRGEEIGVVRFEDVGNTFTISVTVNPAHIGEGIGSSMIEGAVRKVRQETGQTEKPVLAEVKEGNISSQMAFLNAGFVQRSVTFEYPKRYAYINKGNGGNDEAAF
jgi:predicted GNAT family acetyltransferase